MLYFFMYRNKSPNKQAKGVEVRKEKSKIIVKPTVLKKEAEKTKVEAPTNPAKVLQQELWSKAIENVSNISDLSDDESSIVKLLADYKRKASIPQKSIKLKVSYCFYSYYLQLILFNPMCFYRISSPKDFRNTRIQAMVFWMGFIVKY